MNLRQISPADPVSLLGLQGLFEGCSILQDAEFYVEGGATALIETEVAATGGAVITRALNAANAPITYTPAQATLTKRIVSRTIAVDDVVEQRGQDPISELAKRSIKEMRLAGYYLQNLFINGDHGSVATDFDGWSVLVDPTRLLTGANGGVVVPVGGDAVANLQQIAIEQLLQNAKYCRNLHSRRIFAYMNDSLMARWVSVSKKLGYYFSIEEMGVMIEGIRGSGLDIVFRAAGRDATNVELLPFTEAYNGGNSSSIYFVAWGEGQGVTCLCSAGLVGKYNSGPLAFGYNEFTLDMTVGVQDINALVQSTGWKLA